MQHSPAREAPRKVRRRSREHPKISAETCVELAKEVKQYGGVMRVEDFAGAIGYSSHTTGAVVAKIASPQYFGLLTRERGELKSTELLDRLLTPIGDQEQMEARRDAVRHPAIYRELLDAIGRSGPKRPDVVKAIAQRRLGIEPGAVDVFLETFVSSMEWASLAKREDDGSFALREAPASDQEEQFDATIEGFPPEAAAPQLESLSPPEPAPSPSAIPSIQVHIHLEGVAAGQLQDILQSLIKALHGASTED